MPTTINGFDTEEAFVDGRLIGSHFFVPWLKGFFGVRISEMGYRVLLLDTDMVFFSNPLSDFLASDADLIASSDCDNLYHPKHNRYATTLVWTHRFAIILLCHRRKLQAKPSDLISAGSSKAL